MLILDNAECKASEQSLVFLFLSRVFPEDSTYAILEGFECVQNADDNVQ